MTLIYRPATPEDALSISVLAMQVFLDTYALNGMRTDLAREALGLYQADDLRTNIALGTSPHQFIVAERDGYLLGFTALEHGAVAPQPELSIGLKCNKLYVQRHFKRLGIGQQLLRHAELVAAQSQASCVWLTAWIHNTAAITFYEAMGYADVGRTLYYFEGIGHENIVFSKSLN